MIYGRLDVHWPDGPIDSYQLSKTSIAIGRSPGNDITLDATSISRYHASLTWRDDAVYLEDLDSVNGTYIDGRQLSANEPQLISGGEEVQVGEIRLIYHPLDDNPTQPFTPDSTTQRIEVEQASYRIELIEPEGPVTPGVYVQSTLVIQNLSEEVDRYFIEADGVPHEWVRLERVEVELKPEEQAHLMISFKPLRKPDSTPGDYRFTVQVRSKSRPTQTVDTALMLRVLPYHGFGIDLSPRPIAAHHPVKVHAHNQGNAPLQLSFNGQSKNGSLRFDFSPETVTLDAGQRLTVQAAVQPVQPFLVGKPRVTSFIVMARAHDASHFTAALPGKYILQPLLYGWRLGAVIGAAATAVLGLLLLLVTLLTPAPPPEVISFTGDRTEIIQGESLALNWEVANAEALHLELDLVPLDNTPLTIEDTGVVITLNQPGGHEVALAASQGDRVYRASWPIQVHEPLVIANFSASPPEQIRYINREIVLTWDVPGAQQVRLLGLPDATDDTVYGPVDSRLLRLTGAAPLPITLLAEGGAGQTAEVVLTIQVEDPVCRVLADETPIYAGPSTLHRVLGTVNAGESIVPDRRDGSGEWVRVIGTGNQFGWIARPGLECLNFAPLALAVDSAPPTPWPTPTLTLTPSMTPSLTATPSVTPSPTPSPTPTATPSATPSASPTKIIPTSKSPRPS